MTVLCQEDDLGQFVSCVNTLSQNARDLVVHSPARAPGCMLLLPDKTDALCLQENGS
jgi:hypothetical protein